MSMYISERRIKTSQSSKRWKRIVQLKCDQCETLFERAAGGKVDKGIHFCSMKCSQASHSKGGAIRKILEETLRQKHGDNWASVLAQKAQSGMSIESRKARGQKAKQTVIERYGANSAVQIEHVRTACLAAASKPEVIARRKATMKERHGVECMFSLPKIHALCNTPEKCQQRHETMKLNGTYFTSRPEELLYRHLISKFQQVERQVEVKQWSMDFYVKDIDTYIQLDGEYWHGLNRPLDVISEFKTPRDKTIFRKYQIDREQDAWFKQESKRLLRITDKEVLRGELPDELK